MKLTCTDTVVSTQRTFSRFRYAIWVVPVMSPPASRPLPCLSFRVRARCAAPIKADASPNRDGADVGAGPEGSASSSAYKRPRAPASASGAPSRGSAAFAETGRQLSQHFAHLADRTASPISSRAPIPRYGSRVAPMSKSQSSVHASAAIPLHSPASFLPTGRLGLAPASCWTHLSPMASRLVPGSSPLLLRHKVGSTSRHTSAAAVRCSAQDRSAAVGLAGLPVIRRRLNYTNRHVWRRSPISSVAFAFHSLPLTSPLARAPRLAS